MSKVGFHKCPSKSHRLRKARYVLVLRKPRSLQRSFQTPPVGWISTHSRYTIDSRVYAPLRAASDSQGHRYFGARCPGCGRAHLQLLPDGSGTPRGPRVERHLGAPAGLRCRRVGAPGPVAHRARRHGALYRHRADRDVPGRNPAHAGAHRPRSLAGFGRTDSSSARSWTTFCSPCARWPSKKPEP